MQRKRKPPKPAATAEAEPRVARILARYGAAHPVDAAAAPALAEEVRQALVELAGPDGPAPPPNPAAAASRAAPEEVERATRRWHRLVLAAVAAALIVLFWQRLGWIG